MNDTTVAPRPGALAPALRNALVQKIESGSLELPLLPEVAGQALSMTMNEGVDARQLSDLIHRDQAMASHVLRFANSPLYAPTTAIVSLQQAVARLGMIKIREIALAISLESRVFRVQGYTDVVRTLFHHSLAAAAFAREIARSRRWNVEEAFLCGLLHDVGRPVLLQAFVDLSEEHQCELPREGVLIFVDEFHARVGGDLLREWSLPERLSETVLFHHDPKAAPTCARTAMMTRLAADLAHHLVGPQPCTEEDLQNHPLREPLNLYSDELDKLLAIRDEVLATVEALS